MNDQRHTWASTQLPWRRDFENFEGGYNFWKSFWRRIDFLPARIVPKKIVPTKIAREKFQFAKVTLYRNIFSGGISSDNWLKMFL